MSEFSHKKCLVTGAILTGCLIWLFNSKSGKKLCDQIEDKFEDCKEKTKDFMKHTKEKITDKSEEISDELKKSKDTLIESIEELISSSADSEVVEKTLKEVNQLAKKIKKSGKEE